MTWVMLAFVQRSTLLTVCDSLFPLPHFVHRFFFFFFFFVCPNVHAPQQSYTSGSGLRVDDVVAAVNGISVIKATQALKLIRDSKEKVKLNIMRPQAAQRPKLRGRK